MEQGYGIISGEPSGSCARRRLDKGLVMGGSAAFGNAATRLEAFAVKGGAYAYGSYPDIDALFTQ